MPKRKKKKTIKARRESTAKPENAKNRDNLNRRQKRFVEEYLIDLNASAAAIRAGYSDKGSKQTGYNLLTHPDLLAVLEKGIALRSVKAGITAERVLHELALVGFSDVGNYKTDDAGNLSVAEDAPAEVRRAVSSLKTKTFTGELGTEVTHELKLWDKVHALRLIAQHHGMLIDRKDITTQGDKLAQVFIYPSNGREIDPEDDDGS